MNEQRYSNLKLGERGAMISILAYIILSALKLSVGYISDSEALKADGLNNTTDILASLSVLIGLRLSQKPAMKIIFMATGNRKWSHRWSHLSSLSLLVSRF
ncbi:cobalt-zinc-cadmium resistance protein [Mesobacillus boroniphilus JCM 21738]|uniref:Cobalt-zinc-cadmium resistance protein n=1 Tax=Mesobacillus boroniphilus JCM 21738 TaxID=1294265 RepID=W4RLX4_9BACI|nr:cobalt-zinc-cadmium resistance protein [Mesobacillus boroniphilus JCM 21738]